MIDTIESAQNNLSGIWETHFFDYISKKNVCSQKKSAVVTYEICTLVHLIMLAQSNQLASTTKGSAKERESHLRDKINYSFKKLFV